MKIITLSDYPQALNKTRSPWHENYYAMYSSVLGGVVTDPVLMQVPLDDHLVHRGDGVFDTFKCVNRGAYNMEPHLRRLIRSAASIGLEWPGGIDDIRRLTLGVLRIADRDVCSARIILARGPGSFGVSPYESKRPALYIVVYAGGSPFMQRKPEGADVCRSHIPVKHAKFATVKNCNYLPNVMMKREAVDWGVDFVVGFDPDGFMTEGATENFGIVTPGKCLIFPQMEKVLDGTTMKRVMELAEELVKNGELASVGFGNITIKDVDEALEMLIVGTTLNVVSVRHFDDKPIADGVPGSIGKALDKMIFDDISGNAAMRTIY
ncbi:MAG: aminotransferase class IV [Kiritimatiellae bacterium]|jgi:branched-subunit amino acid aminotransferase/4-amino-4-deoxychorismate lyase|nr:aminotransferase class IV [Kiritimatiellia bacterium]